MKRETITMMLNGVDDNYISETAAFSPEHIQESPERIIHLKKKRIITFALAAALMLALGVAAYATGMFGIQALFMKNSAPADNPDSGYVSFTQPQDVPAEMSEDVRAKIYNSTKAWAEWDAWRKENGIFEPEACIPPADNVTTEYVENENGTWTVIFYDRYEPVLDESGEVTGFDSHELERRIISPEEYRQEQDYYYALNFGLSGYDFNYGVYSQDMADELEGIAAKYGLKLRHQSTVLFQNFREQRDFLSKEEMTNTINQVCANGKSFFRTDPTGYDKFYYYDEGTFAISFYTTDNMTNTGTYCYLYNSPYGTMSSGFEIFTEVQDISAFTVRYHTAPDGTRLTVLQNGTEIYAYVYLDNSFVTLHITQLNGLTDAEIDAILDMVDFSSIN